MGVTHTAEAVRMEGICKVFGNFVANDHIDLIVKKGEIHAILGENGAGKSTLMNILYGLYQPTNGSITINGQTVVIDSPNKAIELGIGMVHQHFMLIQPFTVTENIVLGTEPLKSLRRVDYKTARQKVLDISQKYGLQVDPDAKIADISVGMQQRTEILKVLYRGADVLILDEPTASLTPQEIQELIVIMNNLSREGKTIIIITHKLKEIKASAENCTIIRQGKHIDTVKVAETSEESLASMMVGRPVVFKVEKEPIIPQETVLDIKDLVVKDYRQVDVVNGLNLAVRRGEIVGIAGVDGNGQTELVEAITGLRKPKKGTITINGQDIFARTPKEIFDAGVSSIPADRQKHGLVLDFSVAENLILQNHNKPPFAQKGLLKYKTIYNHGEKLMEAFDVRPREALGKPAGTLSGGNQQKAIIAREMVNDKDLLICVNPTRGLDVGAIEYVHKTIVDARNKNKAILLVSFELEEIMSLSDRIEVIFQGKITGSVDAAATNENELGLMMAGYSGGETHES